MLEALIQQLKKGEPLTSGQVKVAVAHLADEHLSVETKAEFLASLARKGESAEEIAAFASELRSKAIVPPLDAETRAREIVDVCGTGGDRLNTFNISTTVALVLAAAGVTVAKHGNRAITSQSGSADVLEALGVRIDLSPAQAAESLRKHHFAFFFAPHYHPAFKHIAPARKLCAERGQRTVFNFLGPLLNPARPTAQLVGVPRPDLCEPLARVLQALGVRRGMVVSGRVGPKSKIASGPGRLGAPEFQGREEGVAADGPFLDELSTLGDTIVAEFYQDRGFSLSSLSVDAFPVQPATLADLSGGDRAANAEIVRRILSGEERGPKRDAVLLNAGAALFVAGRTRTILEAWETAAELIERGKARLKLAELVEASRAYC